MTPDNQIHTGPLLIVLCVLLIAVLVGLFLWGRSLNQTPVATNEITRPTAAENNEPESTTAEAATDTLGILSISTELSTIEADLEATIIDDPEDVFADIEATLGAPLSQFDPSLQVR